MILTIIEYYNEFYFILIRCKNNICLKFIFQFGKIFIADKKVLFKSIFLEIQKSNYTSRSFVGYLLSSTT